MLTSMTGNTKKPDRPKTTGRVEGVMVRLDPRELVRVDEWAGEQHDRPSRAEALRRLATKMLDLLEPPIMRAPGAFEQAEGAEPPLNPLSPLDND